MTPPIQLPPRPSPKATTKVPRVFGLFGTVCYGGAAVTAILVALSMAVFDWTPPWYMTASAFMYVFISSGIIFFGRTEANKDAKFFIHAIKERSEENKNKTRHLN
jgi:hypothetical protein